MELNFVEKNKIRTPLEMLNIMGCGGLDFANMAEVWGIPGGGKSAFCYQTAEMFLEDYKDKAMVLILDSECSFVNLRAKMIFNLCPCNVTHATPDPRVFLETADTIESVCKTICQYINKAETEKKYLLVVWDSINASVTETELETYTEAVDKSKDYDAFKGGMMTKPKILREQLRFVLHYLAHKPVFVLMINQATTKTNKYGGSSVDSGGGFGLKHDVQYRLNFNKLSQLTNDDGIPIATISTFTINKSKNTPRIIDHDILIDDKIGGKFNPTYDLMAAAEKLKWIVAAGGYWEFKESLREKYKDIELLQKKHRKATLFSNPEAFAIIKQEFIQYWRSNFMLVDAAYAELESLTKQPVVKKAVKSIEITAQDK